MGHSASKSGVVIWGPTDCEDLGWDGNSPRSTGVASAGGSNAGGTPLTSGSVPSSLQLRLVEGLKAAAVRSVAAGGKHFACLAQTGELYMWGAGAQGQLGLGDLIDVVGPKVLRPVQSKAVQTVSCGLQHTACVLQDGSAYTWGCALHGRLGLEDLKLPSGGAVLGGSGADLAQLVVPAPRHVRALEKLHVTHVSCGAFHTAFLAITEAGTSLYTCGLGLSGRLGLGDEEDRHVPEKVRELDGLTITEVACGGHHTACITSTGCLYTWGGAAFGKLGLDARVSVRKPTKVEGPLVGKVITTVALGTQHSACTTADGELYTWGQGRRASPHHLKEQPLLRGLGHEERGEADEPLPRQVRALSGYYVTSVACGDSHTVCLIEGGELPVAVGHGDPSCAPNAPTPLRVLRGKGVSHIACGGSRSVALCDAGHVTSKSNAHGDKLPPEKPPAANSRANAQHGVQKAVHAAGAEVHMIVPSPTWVCLAVQVTKRHTSCQPAAQISTLLWCASCFFCFSMNSRRDHAACTQIGGEVSAEMQIAQLSQELQAARVDSLLLAALLKGAATELDAALHRISQLEAEVRILEKSSADAGDRLATLRGHYEQHIKELGQQLAQQDVQFHAALAARNCSVVSNSSHGTGSVASASIAHRFSLEEALADPLGSQRPSLFTWPIRENGSSPASDGASSARVAFDSTRSPLGHSKGEDKPNQALLLRSKSTEPLILPLASATSAAKSSAMLQQQEQAEPSRSKGESSTHTLEDGEALKGTSGTSVIPIFVLEDNENPWS
ncbi:hypothetical protein Esti_000623 [Eimeria stiedai]